MKNNRLKSAIVTASVLLFILAAGVGFFYWAKHSEEKTTYTNFKLKDVQKEQLVDFVVNDKDVLAKLPQFQDKIVKSKEILGTKQVAISVRDPAAAAELVEAIAEKGGSQAIEKDVPIKAFMSFSDPYFTSQTNLTQMEMPAGWDLLADASPAPIAIVDTGIRGTHEDLVDRVLAGYNVLTGATIVANTNSDDNGHGTAMASAAAAIGGNGVGLVGTAFTDQIYPVKVLNAAGVGLGSDGATGIRWAANAGARVINLSWGGSDYSSAIHDALQYAVDRGCLVVAASGNDGGTLSYPASDSLALSIGSVNTSLNRSSFSNYGDELDLVAPGESIVVASSSANNAYTTATGTSVAAAEASGIMAYATIWHTGASVAEKLQYVREAAYKVGGLGGTDHSAYYGYGLIDYYRLLTTYGNFHHSFVTQSGYATLSNGQAANLWVRVQNTGTTTWTRGQVNLGTARERDRVSPFTREGGNPSGWVSQNRVRFEESSVAPGQTATFSFWVRNDGVGAGTYREYFQLVSDHGGGWMEDYGIYWDITVPSATDLYKHSFITQSGYATLSSGQAANLWVKVQNTGSVTWTRGQVNLGTSHDRDRVSPFTREGGNPSGWVSPNRVRFEESSVAPGQTATFSFWVRNDGVGAGTYREYFQLVAENITWMEDYGIYWDVKAVGELEKYQYSHQSQSGYATLSSGQAANLWVKVQNTGSVTWTRGQVNLGTSHDRDRVSPFTREGGNPSGWVSPNRVQFEESSVAPGQTATFSFWVRNDGVGAGTYREYFQPVADGVGWMADTGIYWEVTVP